MMKASALAALLVVGAAGSAHAGGQANSLGVGAEVQLSGIGGVAMNYDAGDFHTGGVIGYDRVSPMGAPATYVFDIGGRFFYHLHSTAMSDFGLGGELGIESVPSGMGNGHNTYVYIDPGFQVRVFLASNVALSFTGGIVIATADTSEIAVAGQTTGGGRFSIVGGGAGFVSGALTGGAGITYYFF